MVQMHLKPCKQKPAAENPHLKPQNSQNLIELRGCYEGQYGKMTNSWEYYNMFCKSLSMSTIE